MKLVYAGALGTFLVAETFEEHMAPTTSDGEAIEWHDDPAGAQAFAQAFQEQSAMTEYTKPNDGNGNQTKVPGFIQLRFERGGAMLTVRGDPLPVDGDDDADRTEAPTAELWLEQTEWDQFVSWATRDRGLVPL